jgi:hypothetical protein
LLGLAEDFFDGILLGLADGSQKASLKASGILNDFFDGILLDSAGGFFDGILEVFG